MKKRGQTALIIGIVITVLLTMGLIGYFSFQKTSQGLDDAFSEQGGIELAPGERASGEGEDVAAEKVSTVGDDLLILALTC